MKQAVVKYLFYTVALSALLAPFAMQAADLKSDMRLARETIHQDWRGPDDARPEQRARPPRLQRWAMRRAMARLDTNGDGKIDPAEFQAPPKDRFAEIDQNGDGAMTLEELKQYRERQAEMRIEKRFAELDGDGDGKVTREEIARHRFALLDRDGDGYLSPRELFQARAPRPPAPPAP